MEPHQTLNAFLPKLWTALVRRGMSDQVAAFTCNALRAGAQQQAITSPQEYREARTVHAIIDYEDAYAEQHGGVPLNSPH